MVPCAFLCTPEQYGPKDKCPSLTTYSSNNIPANISFAGFEVGYLDGNDRVYLYHGPVQKATGQPLRRIVSEEALMAAVVGLLRPALDEVAGAVVTGKRRWWPPDRSICACRISYIAVVQ